MRTLMNTFSCFVVLAATVGCATSATDRGVSSSADSSATGKPLKSESFECKTPGVMDSGYKVAIAPSSKEGGKQLFGTIATLSAWGTDQKLYEGPFTVEVAPAPREGTQTSKNCVAELKGGKGPTILATVEGRKSAMRLTDGGAEHELTCRFPALLLETMKKCEAELKN